MYNTGIDVSEHNGEIDWEEIRRAGIAFAIIRLGWGRGHLDRLFYEHINGALAAGLLVGVYYYSYADTPKAAEDEAWFTVHVLADCGLSPEKLPLGVWYDMIWKMRTAGRRRGGSWSLRASRRCALRMWIL